MIQKPDACLGCPLYGDGLGFCPDEVREEASIAFIAQAPGENEEREGRPLIGRSGKMVEGHLNRLGLRREDASWMNVLKCRWKHQNDLPKGESLAAAVDWCTSHHLIPNLRQVKPNVFVPLGDLALGYLSKRTEITRWRGSCFVHDGRKILPTVHPSYTFKEPTLRLAVKSDFARIVRESRQKEPVIQYHDNFRLGATVGEFGETLKRLAGRRVVLDIETSSPLPKSERRPIDERLVLVGIAWSKTDALVYAYRDEELGELLAALAGFEGEWITATAFDYTVLACYGATFQWERCHDLTLLHSRYDIETSHELEFIASMWTDRPFWKWMSATEPMLYNALDCVGEWEAFDRLWAYCANRDRGVLAIYEEDRKLLPVQVDLHLTGMMQDPERFTVEKAFFFDRLEGKRGELEKAFTPEPREAPLPCPTHKRYSGKTKVGLRKGETVPCAVCHAIYIYATEMRPTNLRSRKQLAARLRADGVTIPRDRKTKKETLAKGAVAKLAKKVADPRLGKLLDFWKDDTVLSRYFKKNWRTKRDGRIHPVYAMHTAKHRWACSKPNMQQQKRAEEE